MHRLAALLVVAVACGSAETPTPAPAARPATPVSGPALAPPTEPGRPPPAPTSQTMLEPLTQEAFARAQALTKVFATGACDPAALEELRALVGVYGDVPPLVGAQTVAFKACEDLEALAELTARTLPDDATALQRLQLGAAWLRAARYEEAAAVLEPLARSEGPTSKAAWLAGFALFHGGRSAQARPLLESARAQAPKDLADAWLLIGLCKLHDGDVDDAAAEFEAGTAVIAEDPSLWSALARARAAQGRDDEARAARAQARRAHEARAVTERAQSILAARVKALQAAAAAQDIEGVERHFEQAWPDASTKLRVQMLQLRAGVYTRAGRTDDANADRAKATTLAAP